jgi:hypothetical protein
MIEYRTSATQPADTREPDVPAAIRNACRIMYAGEVASAIHAVVALVTTGATKTALQQKHPQWSAGTLSTLTTITVFAIAAMALIGLRHRSGGTDRRGAVHLDPRACRRGRNAARITAAVLAVLGVLAGVCDVSIGRGAATLIVGFAVTAIGLLSAALLWLSSSGAYFRYFKRPQLWPNRGRDGLPGAA